MDDDAVITTFKCLARHLSAASRPLRLRLGFCNGKFDDVLLPQRIEGVEAICEGIEVGIFCVAEHADIVLKELIGLPVGIQIVTDRGELRSICGIVTEARSGESDGGLATYQLVLRDALSLMEKRINSRIFRNKSEPEIVQILCAELRQADPVLGAVFEFEFDDALTTGKYPRREATYQHNESDAAFLRRLLKRRGICWYFRAGRSRTSAVKANGEDDTPAHTLVMFDNVALLKQNAAGAVRFHRDDATEERDTITAWSGVRTLQAGSVTRHSWDYRNPLGAAFMSTTARSNADQGPTGNILAATLDDYLIEMPHVANDNDDHCTLGRVRMARHDFNSKCFQAEGAVRDFCVAEYFSLDGHPEIDTHAAAEREFVIIAQRFVARNNLPKALDAKVERLFALTAWGAGRADVPEGGDTTRPVGFRSRFTCVRRGIPIVPAFDPRVDLPPIRIQSAIVVGPPGEEVHCDEFGRVKVRFPGMRAKDHAHANGAGASDTDADSAWLRVATGWAGKGPGGNQQCGIFTLPRVGTEVPIDFLGGDPDKPLIVNQLFNTSGAPPALSKEGNLPGNRYLSGIKSQEVQGTRSNQLCFDDTPGQISAQLASDHGVSELNLGFLTQPRNAGRGETRGEGAELRSNKATAIRGGAGVLISADAGASAHGSLLERAGLLGLADALQSIAGELSTLATTHAGDGDAGAPLTQLIGRLKEWDKVAKGANAAHPIVAAHADAGMVLASQDSLMLGAQTKVDVLCAGDIDAATGRHLALHAGQGITLFAHEEGIKIITAGGTMVLENHRGDIEIKSPGNISLTAGKRITMQAPELVFIAQGAQVNYGNGSITHQCTGAYAVKSATFAHAGPGGGAPAGLTFPSTKIRTDERHVITDRQNGLPIKGRRYTATGADGKTITGVTDEHGRTDLFKGDRMGTGSITLHDDE